MMYFISITLKEIKRKSCPIHEKVVFHSNVVISFLQNINKTLTSFT